MCTRSMRLIYIYKYGSNMNEPTIYNNLQYHNLHVLVDTQPSKRFQTHHTKTFVAALNHMNTVSEEYFFNYKNHISMKSFTQRANQ